MKRILISLLCAFAVLSCTRDVIRLSNADGETPSGVQHAYIVNPGGDAREDAAGTPTTRTDFDSYEGKFAWSDGDRIAIHLSDGTFYETPVDAETGVFTCSTTPSKKRDAYAVYPASARDASNYGSPTLNVILPAEYNITDNLASDYSPVPMIAVNRQAEDDLYFRHVGGLLRITCDRVPVGTQKIAVMADRNIAGTFAVANPASESPTITTGGSTPTVTFRIAANALTSKTSGIVLNVPVPVGQVASLRLAALDATGAEIYAVTRELNVDIPRIHGKKFVYSLTEVFTDSMQMVITANAFSEYGFRYPNNLRNYPADLTISWGDGTYDFIPAGNSGPAIEHTYAAEGDYTVTFTAETEVRDGPMIPMFTFDRTASKKIVIKSIPTPLLKMAVQYADRMFWACEELESVCGDLFSKNPDIPRFQYTFYNCTRLSEIPEDLFSYTPHVTSFSHVFQSCVGLGCSIPSTLFARNPEAVNFEGAFQGCSGLTGSIPAALFANNITATEMSLTFYGCSGLTGSIPSDLFANNPALRNLGYFFSGCNGLTGPIPSNLFANNPALTNIGSVFSGCRGLSGSIPGGLFATNTALIYLNGAFLGCSGLTGAIPENLFSTNVEANSFGSTFQDCTGLSGSIPADLFAGNAKAAYFGNAFYNCAGLSGSIPGSLFAANTAAQSFNSTFYGCTGLTGAIPGNLFSANDKAEDFSGTFSGCTGLSGSIPPGLFASNPAAKSFMYTFLGCGGLTGGIPANLFSANLSVTSFFGTFSRCAGLSGEIPEDLFASNPEVETFRECFVRCIGLTRIPAGLFRNQTKAKDFSGTFHSCTGLTGDIPAGLFANNTMATSFQTTFHSCENLLATAKVFIGDRWTADTRFSASTEYLHFEHCFAYIGGGTAPDLWNYNLGTGGYSSYMCFVTPIQLYSNWADIPPAWGRT